MESIMITSSLFSSTCSKLLEVLLHFLSLRKEGNTAASPYRMQAQINEYSPSAGI
uniref:Uncharacterized protein n=1 Tax=Anguilla anguilla TaxID=7936 RepID=A0A0E9PGS8_ANGAN